MKTRLLFLALILSANCFAQSRFYLGDKVYGTFKTTACGCSLGDAVSVGNVATKYFGISTSTPYQEIFNENTSTLQSTIIRTGSVLNTALNDPSFYDIYEPNNFTSSHTHTPPDEDGTYVVREGSFPLTIGPSVEQIRLDPNGLVLNRGVQTVASIHRIGYQGFMILQDGASHKTFRWAPTLLTAHRNYDAADNDGVIPAFIHGKGTPEGSITANIGVVYINDLGGANVTLWVKESGTGNTGWAAK